MAKTRDSYIVTGSTPDEMKRSMNFLLQRLADRMDRIEGIRGTASIESTLDMNANRITELAEGEEDTDALNRDQADLTGASPTFATITTTGDATIGGDIEVLDSNSTVIHSLE
jgi:hypothetical protein